MRLRAASLAAALAACGPRTSPMDAAVDVAMAGDSAGESDVVVSPPPGQWTWLDVPGAVCGDGSATGVGVNPSPSGSRHVMVYLEGGGACWDAATCLGPMPAASHLTGYGADDFAIEGRLVTNPLFARDDATNPLRDATMVYVPYCTGDLHAGRRVATYTGNGTTRSIHHMGGASLDATLAALHARWPDADRLWLTGTSAGGYGAVLGWDRAAATFAPARVDVLDDSGPFVEPVAGLWASWYAAWGLAAPSDCAACASSLGAWFDHARAAHVGSRFGLLSFANDVIESETLRLDAATFAGELGTWTTRFDAADSRYFVVGSAGHVVLVAPPPSSAVLPWIGMMVSDDPAWVSQMP